MKIISTNQKLYNFGGWGKNKTLDNYGFLKLFIYGITGCGVFKYKIRKVFA